MRAAIEKLQPDGNVRMSREQFVYLAQLIDRLADSSTPPDHDSFFAPINGIRWWIPLPEHRRVLSQLDAARLRVVSPDQDATASPAYPTFQISS